MVEGIQMDVQTLWKLASQDCLALGRGLGWLFEMPLQVLTLDGVE